MRATVVATGWFCLVLLIVGGARAEEAKEDGQADLDRAMEAKLSARNPRDLNTVIRLCETALDKELSEKSKGFAKQLLASSLLERGSDICDMLFGRGTLPPQWAQARQISLADLERALQYDPTLVDAHLQIARLQTLPGGDRKRAITALTEIVSLSAADPARQADALMLRGGMQESEEEGLADLNNAVELAPKDPKPLRTRGAMKFGLKDVDGAIADFDAAIELAPDDAATHEAKALALASQQKWEASRESFDRAAKLAPDSTEVFLQRGRVNALAGNTDAALADFSEVLRIDPDNVAALVLRAEVAIPDHLDEAMEDLNKALDLRPGLVPALRQRAVLLANAKKFTAAVADLELAQKLDPEDQSATLQLAAVYAIEGKTETAIEVYDKVLEADPTSWMAFRGRGDLQLNLGKQREAIADYEKALEVKEDDSGVLNNLAWVLATSPDEALRDGKRAIDLAKKACEETEYKQAHILSTLAAGYAETGDFVTAVEWSKKAVELGSDDLKPALSKELESYESSKPWRETQTASADTAKPSDSTRR